jgi:O-antigen ligase
MADAGIGRLTHTSPRDTYRTLFATGVYLALLLLIFVGLEAFSPPPLVSQFGGVTEASKGDILRQILYLGVGALAVLAALGRHGLGALRAIPPMMALLLAWCLASALWAPEPNVVIRRAGLEIVIVGALLLSVDTVEPQRAFWWWRWLLAAVLLVNFLSIPLVPVARHLAGETDPALVGNWRGLYGHKNIAGAVCAITAILFLFTRTGWKNIAGIAIAAAAVAFLVMTHSKTSMGLLPVALLAGLAYRIGWRDGLGRAILCVAALLLLAMLASFALLDAGLIAHVLEDPREFTGRAAIWAAELRFIGDHPLLGSGFGTFADTGGLSPLHGYVDNRWVEAVSHGHNGYLQILVTIGGTGFILAILAVVVWPLRRFWALDHAHDSFKPMLFALFVFLVLHNFMESDFLEGDGVGWGAMLMVIAALNRPPPHLVRP